MVARLLRLRVALLASALRGGPRAVGRRVLIAVSALAVTLALAALPQVVTSSAQGQQALQVMLSSLVLACALLVPFFGAPRLLEPRQFSGIPASPAQIAGAMLLTNVVTWSVLLLIVFTVAQLLLSPARSVDAWIMVTTGVLTVLLAVLFVRVSSGLLRLTASRRLVVMIRWIGVTLLLALLPVLAFVFAEAIQDPTSATVRETATVLGWTPFGAPMAMVSAAFFGDPGAALPHLAVAAATVVVLGVAWFFIVQRSLATIERPFSNAAQPGTSDAFDRLPANPRSAIASRAITYWIRDPRYRVALIAIPVAPLITVLALAIVGVGPEVLSLLPVPIMLLLLGWSVHNDISFDSTAIWMHVATGTKGLDDRIGRLAPVFLIGLPLLMFGSSISVIIGTDWRILPAVIGVNFAVLLVASAVASVFSVVWPYPSTRPGDTPFAQPSVQGSGAGLVQTVSMIVTLVLLVPAVSFSVIAIAEPTLLNNVFALVFGVVWGLAFLLLGVFGGGRLFERRGPELVALTQSFD